MIVMFFLKTSYRNKNYNQRSMTSNLFIFWQSLHFLIIQEFNFFYLAPHYNLPHNYLINLYDFSYYWQNSSQAYSHTNILYFLWKNYIFFKFLFPHRKIFRCCPFAIFIQGFSSTKWRVNFQYLVYFISAELVKVFVSSTPPSPLLNFLFKFFSFNNTNDFFFLPLCSFKPFPRY